MNDATGSWTVVMTTQSMVEAEIVKAKLKLFGIEAGLRFESIGRLYGITQNGLAKVEIIVPTELFGQATELIRDK